MSLFVHLLVLALTMSGGVWPLVPRPEVVAGFAPPDQVWGAGHRGVDLRGHPGQPVLAAVAGEVSHAGPVAGTGVVVVRHGDTRTTYQPVVPAVRPGTRVRAGQVLGHLVLLGSHCLPRACLHWGLRRGESYLDPLVLVGAGPVRLLPWQGPADPLPGPPLTGLPLPGPPPATGSWLFRPAGAPAGRPAGGGPW